MYIFNFYREPELPEDTNREESEHEESENEPETIHEDMVTRFKQLTQEIAPKALTNIASAQKKQKKYYDRRINPQNVHTKDIYIYIYIYNIYYLGK